MLLGPLSFAAQHPIITLLMSQGLFSLLRPTVARSYDFLDYCDEQHCQFMKRYRARRAASVAS